MVRRAKIALRPKKKEDGEVQIPQHVKRKTTSTRPQKKACPQIIKSCASPYITQVEKHCFKNGHEVNIFEVSDYCALNQLIGYAKFLNTDYGDVYYRGEVELHDTLLPSVSRKAGSKKYERELNRIAQGTVLCVDKEPPAVIQYPWVMQYAKTGTQEK